MKVIVQNLAVEYRDEGSGPVVLFLHGWKDSLRTFDALIPLLCGGNRIVRLDLPGFGASEAPKDPWDLDRYAAFVADFARKLNLDVYALAGHSFGGRIIIKGRAAKQLSAKKIILVASAGVSRKRPVRSLFLASLAKIGRSLTLLPPLSFWRERLRKKIYERLGSDYYRAGSLKDTFVKIVNEDLSRAAEHIADPALLIWGSEDSSTPLADGQRLAGLIKGSMLKVLDGAGHFVHKEKPEEVAAFIREFLS